MKKDGYSWSLIIDWVLDWFLSFSLPGYLDAATTKLPPLESTDGQEPTAESLREKARQADARPRAEAKTLTSTDKKVLDKEFWETM